MRERSAPRSSFLGVVLLSTAACWLVEPLDHLPVSHDASAADARPSTCENCQGGCCNNGTCVETGFEDETCGSNGEQCTNCGTVGGSCTFLSESESYSCACGPSAGCTTPATCSPNFVCCFPSGATADTSNPQDCCSGVVSGGTCT